MRCFPMKHITVGSSAGFSFVAFFSLFTLSIRNAGDSGRERVKECVHEVLAPARWFDRLRCGECRNGTVTIVIIYVIKIICGRFPGIGDCPPEDFFEPLAICITWIHTLPPGSACSDLFQIYSALALRPQRSTFNSYRNLLSGEPSYSSLLQYQQEKQVQHPSPVSPPLTLPRIRSLQIRTISSAINMLQCICGPLLFLNIVISLFGMATRRCIREEIPA